MSYDFHSEAFAEALLASTFYESRQSGLGESFRLTVESLISRIEARPEMFSLHAGFPAELGVRVAKAPRFPYVVAYHVGGEKIHILAVAHTGRDATYWRHRLPSN